MTTEHRDKFRFSYLIIAHCNTFSKDKLHYYYASFFLTFSPINGAHLPPAPPPPFAILTSLHIILPSMSHNFSHHTERYTILLNLVRELMLFWHICRMNKKVIFKEKTIARLRTPQLSFLLAASDYRDGPKFCFVLICRGTKHCMSLWIADVSLWLKWPVYKKEIITISRKIPKILSLFGTFIHWFLIYLLQKWEHDK